MPQVMVGKSEKEIYKEKERKKERVGVGGRNGDRKEEADMGQ